MSDDEEGEEDLLDANDEETLFELTQSIIKSLIPSVVFRVIGTERLNDCIDLILSFLRWESLNKYLKKKNENLSISFLIYLILRHFIYCFLDLMLLTLYEDDFSENF